MQNTIKCTRLLLKHDMTIKCIRLLLLQCDKQHDEYLSYIFVMSEHNLQHKGDSIKILIITIQFLMYVDK